MEYVRAKLDIGTQYSPIDLGEHSIKVQTFDRGCNEFLLYHGSPNASSVAQHGADVNKARDVGLFGKGFYLTNLASKADVYTGKAGSNKLRMRQVVVCRCALGAAHLTGVALKGIDAAPDGCDSVVARSRLLGDASAAVKYPEMVVFDANAALPEFLITYRHIPGCACVHCE